MTTRLAPAHEPLAPMAPSAAAGPTSHVMAPPELPVRPQGVETTGLTGTQWLVDIGVASTVLIVEELRKLVVHRS